MSARCGPGHEAYHAAIDADDAWGRELRRIFGARAGDARYDARGVSTPELRGLCEAKVAADAARRGDHAVGFSTSELSAYNRRVMFGADDEAFPDPQEWARVVD